MRVIIAGPRDLYVTNKAMREAIEKSAYPLTEILNGGSSGIDFCATVYAQKHSIPFSVCFANWDELGKAAGPARNRKMARRADALIVIKRKGDTTKGTRNMIEEARKMCLYLYVEEVE